MYSYSLFELGADRDAVSRILYEPIKPINGTKKRRHKEVILTVTH